MKKSLFSVFCLAAASCVLGAEPAWPEITAEMRPWSYNWWMGNAVDPAGLDLQAKEFAEGGLGGYHIIPIYAAKDPRHPTVSFLSEDWLKLFETAVSSAEKQGLGVDLTMGCGWCFGGPWIPIEQGFWRVQLVSSKKELKKFSRVLWEGKAADGKPLILAAHPARMNVKRAPAGDVGLMLDPFSPEAMRTHLAPFTAAFDRPNAVKPRRMYHDSFEYFGAAWTPKLFEAFLAKRGYDLRDHLPALAGVGDLDEIRRVKHDYRETLSDLQIETFTLWTDWCRARGIRTRNEAHGSPCNWLDFYRIADIPETEMFGEKDRDVLVSKFASSSAHFKGTPQVSSESCTWIAEHFQERLGDIKVFLDRLLLAGINHVFYHGSCYSPADAAWPGWCYYASLEMNPRNPIWHDAPILNNWLARCQALGQTSTPDEDVLIYWPIHDTWRKAEGFAEMMTVHNAEDWFRGSPFGKLARRLWNEGVQFDYVSDRMLMDLPPAAQTHWTTIVVPPCESLPLATAKRLAELAAAGYRVHFAGPRPQEVPGWLNAAAQKQELAQVLAQIPASDLVCRRSPFAGAVESRRLKRGDDTLYYVANDGNAAATLADLKLGGRAWSLDPMDGTVRDLYDQLELAPGASVWVWVSPQEAPRTKPAPVEMSQQTIALSRPWTLTPLCGGPSLDWTRTMPQLTSWSRTAEGAENPFCGTVRYRTTFDWKGTPTAGEAVVDLGTVSQSARVRLNGEEVGACIMAPYRVAFPASKLKDGENVLEVDVTSLGANRIRDLDQRKVAWKIFTDINIVTMDYKKFDASKWPLRDAGLLGPVVLNVSTPR